MEKMSLQVEVSVKFECNSFKSRVKQFQHFKNKHRLKKRVLDRHLLKVFSLLNGQFTRCVCDNVERHF